MSLTVTVHPGDMSLYTTTRDLVAGNQTPSIVKTEKENGEVHTKEKKENGEVHTKGKLG